MDKRYTQDQNTEVKYGVIQEQGDLGLGFDELDEEENKKTNKALKDKE